MKRVDIIKLYASDDENFCMGALRTYFYVDGELVLSGSTNSDIDSMIMGAKALMHFQDQKFNTYTHKIANAQLFYNYQKDFQKIYDEVVGSTTKTSSYGNF